jgi:hypothetical protein
MWILWFPREHGVGVTRLGIPRNIRNKSERRKRRNEGMKADRGDSDWMVLITRE